MVSAHGRKTVFLSALTAAVCGAAFPSRAATVTLTAADAIGTTSFNTAGHWSNAAAPSSGNDYVIAGGGTAGFNMRTPPVAGNFTFAGNSLTLGDGGTNLGAIGYKGTGPATDVITINNLTANFAQINNANGSSTFTLAGSVTVAAGGLTIGTSGDGNGTARTVIIAAPMSGPGAVTVTSNVAPFGSAVLSGTNTYTGGTTVAANATLRVAQVASLPGFAAGGTPAPITLGTGATLSLFVGGTGDFAASDLDRVRANTSFGTNSFLGFDTTDVPAGFTYGTSLSGSFGFAKTGTNTLFLTGANTYTGGTNLGGGTLNFANIGNLGTGPINFNGGTLQFATGNTTDITTAATVNLAGTGIIDSNGNNLTFAGAISGTTGSFTKTGAGSLTLTSTVTPVTAFVRQGQLVLTGTGSALTTSAYVSIGQLGGDNGTLTVKDGAKLTVNNDFNVSDVSPSVGTMFIADNAALGTTVSVKTLYLGKDGADSGAISQTGGTVQSVTGAGDWRIGGNVLTTDSNAVGTYDISGGTMTTVSNFQPGAYGVGQMTLSGSASVTVAGYPSIGRFASSQGTLNVLGGTFTQSGTGNFIIVGESGTGTLNVSGTGTVNASNGAQLRLGNLTVAATPGVGYVNLGVGGTILAKAVNTAGSAATSVFDFHGGTLTSTAASTTYMTGLTGAYVYGEGGIINTNGFDITVAQPLLAPGGGGVLTVPVTSGGAGYAASPVITILGDGLGGAAIPVLSNGVLTAVIITNPGMGYTSPAAIVSGGNPTTPATVGIPTLGANASGALTKQGMGTLTLSGVNTYSGGTVLNGGRLAVGVVGALGSTGNISLALGTTLDVSALGSTGFTVDVGRTLISAAATVTGVLNVSGTYQSTGASAVNGGLTVNAGGVVSAAGGSLTLTGAVTNNGTILMTQGAVLSAAGATSFVNNGVINLLDGTAQFPSGFSNGTNGVVLTSNLVQVTAVSKTSTAVNVSINGLTGFSYQLQRSPTLINPNYVNVGAPQTGTTGTILTLTDAAPTGTQAFYRVVLSR